MQHVAGGLLEVEPFGGGVRSDEHPHLGRRIVEGVPHRATLTVIHAAIERKEAGAVSVVLTKPAEQVIKGCLELGEQDQPFVRLPLVTVENQAVDQRDRFGEFLILPWINGDSRRLPAMSRAERQFFKHLVNLGNLVADKAR